MEKLPAEKDGKVLIYDIELAGTGQPNREVSVPACGKLNAEKEMVPLDQVPAAPRAAIEAGLREPRSSESNGPPGSLARRSISPRKRKRKLSISKTAGRSLKKK